MRIIPLLLLPLFISSSCKNSSANIDLRNEKEVRKALASTWLAELMENSGSLNKVPENRAILSVLNEDGTYTAGVKGGVIKQSGEWSYDTKTQMLRRGNSSSRVLKLNSKELITSEYFTLNSVIRDSTVVTYKRL